MSLVRLAKGVCVNEPTHGKGGNGHGLTVELATPSSKHSTGTPEVDSSAASAQPLRRVPTGEVVTMAERKASPTTAPTVRSGDLNFTISMPELLKVVGFVLALAAAWWSLRSDLRDIQTNMKNQSDRQDERYQQQKESMSDLQRKWQLQQLDIKDIQLSLARAGINSSGGTITIQGGGKP